MSKPHQPIESFQPGAAAGNASPDLSRHVWDNMPRTATPLRAEPASINFAAHDIYASAAKADSTPPVPPAELKKVLGDPKASINFTTPAQDSKPGARPPDYFMSADGQLHKNPDAKPDPTGKINIELQTKNKTEVDAKKVADQLQKSAVKDLLNYFKNSHPPGTPMPQDWLDQLNKEPDLPPAPAPLDSSPAPSPTDTTPQQQPTSDTTPLQPQQPVGSDGGGGGGSSGGGGGGSSGGGGGGDSGAGGGGSSGGGGGGSSGGGGDTSVPPGTTYDGASPPADPKTAGEMAKLVVQEGHKMGLSDHAIVAAVADMMVESGGNPKASGDGGHSIGLFQLNDAGGEGTGMTVAQREDPITNIDKALQNFKSNENAGDYGVIAYNAERPADRAAYIPKVDSYVAQAKQMTGINA